LTLARAIVGLHGGSIDAASEGLGRGSEFMVRLPLFEPADGRMPSEPHAQGCRHTLN
jgi:signal transduction histidine kinase